MYHKLKQLAAPLKAHLNREEKTLFYWVPVCYGLGIALYFSLKAEPSLKIGLMTLGITFISYLYMRFKGALWQRYIALGFTLIALGFTAVKLRTDLLNTPIIVGELGFQKLEGTVKSLERLPSYTRVILEDVTFSRKLRQDLPIPTKIRLSLRGRLQPASDIVPGERVQVKASLAPPSRPVAPGSYDFRRRAYFEGIGAVGYGITALTLIKNTPQSQTFSNKIRHKIMQLRESLTYYIRIHVPGQSGAVIAALVTGDRSGIKDETRQAFADAGIAHILAISGLHLSIVAGLIFFVIRGLLSLIPPLALRHNTKKIAAAIALVFTFGYLILSGATIPAERAFIMTSLILIAVMTDRIALTLRNVALAALIVLIIAPESLVGPSFQLSFAAVIGLVAAYEKVHPLLTKWQARVGESRFPSLKKLSLYLSGLIFSSLIATLATAPFTIFTFNRFSLVAILTNLIAIPLVSFAIMPLIVFALLTAPLTIALTNPLLDSTLSLLINIAFRAQQLPGAVILVPQVNTTLQVMCVGGLLWLAFMQSSWRKWGLIPVVTSLIMSPLQRQPDMYIPQEQNLIGYYNTEQKQAWVNTLQSGRFSRKAWLQLVGQSDATKLSDKKKCDNYEQLKEGCYHIKKGNITLQITQTNELKWRKKYYQLEVAIETKGKRQPLLTHKDFKYKGGHFIWLNNDGTTRIQSVQDISGIRPWS